MELTSSGQREVRPEAATNGSKELLQIVAIAICLFIYKRAKIRPKQLDL
jgi:hypothetical protein